MKDITVYNSREAQGITFEFHKFEQLMSLLGID